MRADEKRLRDQYRNIPIILLIPIVYLKNNPPLSYISNKILCFVTLRKDNYDV